MTDISPIMIGSPETGLYKRQLRPLSILDRSLIVPAIGASFRKLDPRTLVKNPVMFCVEVVSVLTTIFFVRDLIVGGGTVVGTNALFSGQITVWLWFTVLFANFAEAVAEGRGKAQADALRRTRTETKAKHLQAANSQKYELVDATALRPGDMVLVETNDLIPSDGEVIFGGVGSGLYGILAFAIAAMFVAGLMVGRTPEYLGKKLEAKEVKMTILALLSLPLSILGWTALATVVPAGLAGIANGGPHGFSEILYAYTEGTGNNGSAFAGLSANTLFYNTTIGFAMLIGRFIFVIPMLAVAGSLAQKKLLAPSAGTFPTNRPLFVGLLVGVVLIIGGLTYFPAVSLGPGVEQVAMNQGKLFPAP